MACGPSATVVCLLPWDGPDEEQWTWEQEEEREQKRREKERRYVENVFKLRIYIIVHYNTCNYRENTFY